MRRLAPAIVALVAVGALPGCHAKRPLPAVPVVVAGSASAWPVVTIGTPSGAPVEVPSELRRQLTPLLATRALERPLALADYGLDHPQAQLVYKSPSGATAAVELGQANFDRHFVYAQRQGRPTVYLIAADTLRPVLALVGIEVKPPDQ